MIKNIYNSLRGFNLALVLAVAIMIVGIAVENYEDATNCKKYEQFAKTKSMIRRSSKIIVPTATYVIKNNKVKEFIIAVLLDNEEE